MDGRRWILRGGSEEELLSRELARQVAGGLYGLDVDGWSGQRLFGIGQWLGSVLEHAHDWQSVFSQLSVLLGDSLKVLSQYPQFLLGSQYTLVTQADRVNDPGNVVLGCTHVVDVSFSSCAC